MQKDPLLYLAIGALIGGLVVWFLATTAVNNNQYSVMQMMGMGGTSAMMGNASEMNAHFIEQMIPHHEDAITMSQLALTKAERSEVKQLAESIIASQSKEIEQMRAWYKEWFGRELPTGEQVMQRHGMMSGSDMHMGMMGDTSDLTRLEQSADFDRAFVEEMIPHHQMAVMMASMLKNSTNRPEMKKLADDIITAQTKEIDIMRQWLAEWE